jgi:hypothetical protein
MDFGGIEQLRYHLKQINTFADLFANLWISVMRILTPRAKILSNLHSFIMDIQNRSSTSPMARSMDSILKIEGFEALQQCFSSFSGSRNTNLQFEDFVAH